MNHTDPTTWQQNTLKQLFKDPLADRGNGLQALAFRHARLYVHMNIWKQRPEWAGIPMGQFYAFALYCRLVQRYGIACPLGDRPDVVGDQPRCGCSYSQALARMLYIAAFSQELSRYLWRYIDKQAGRWNARIEVYRNNCRTDSINEPQE